MASKNGAYSSSSFCTSSSSSQLSTPRVFQNGSSQPTASNEEVIREEIVELETEIFRLERYLLSLYRTSFGDHLSASLLQDDSPPLMPYTSIDRVSSASETDKFKRSTPGNPSLADLLGLNTLSPNKISEDIVRLICMIHVKLSKEGLSSDDCGRDFGVVISKLCIDHGNLQSIESMLQKFRWLVQKLEKVDPKRMAREEKLAFWINIHNALMMHGYIVYGRSKLILKAAFNVGGEWVNAYDVQSLILGIRASRSKKSSGGGHSYALDYIEPLLHFALSKGASTDPMVRVYTADGIFQQLNQARDCFIRTNVVFENNKRILLPNIIYNYAKDTCLSMAELFNAISECLVETHRTTMIRVLKKKQDRCIRWIKPDSNFRYIIDWELAVLCFDEM